MFRCMIAFAVLIATPALAQQQPDIATLQRVIAILQQQRNQAMDTLASSEVQRAVLAEEIERFKARIAEMEKKNANAQ